MIHVSSQTQCVIQGLVSTTAAEKRKSRLLLDGYNLELFVDVSLKQYLK